MISLVKISTTDPRTTNVPQLLHHFLFGNESQRQSSLCLLLWYSCNGNFQSCLWWPWHLFKIDNTSSACYWLKVQSVLLNNHCKSNVVSLIALIVKFRTHSAVFRFPRNVWWYYSANQKPLFIEQVMQWQNKKSTTRQTMVTLNWKLMIEQHDPT